MNKPDTNVRRNAGLAKGRATQAHARGKMTDTEKKAAHDRGDVAGHTYHSIKAKS